MSRHWMGATFAIATLSLATTTTSPHVKAASAPPPDCFAAMRNSASAARLTCTHAAWLTQTERADLMKLTRGYLQDARCTVAVSIDRHLIDEGLAASDRAFSTPPQPVTCHLQTSGGPMTISGSFAPNVTFKDGFAVDATPGLANVTGVNSYLAWPVIAYVNNAPSIKSEMTAMINAFRAQLTLKQQARN
jgi:hypothetical protein